MTNSTSFEGLERFDQVDRTQEQAMFIAFLDRVETFPDVVARRRASYELLRAEPGKRLADIGCGLGTAVFELAGMVGATGAASGADLSDAMIAEARVRAKARGAEVTFHQADALALPFETGALDGYRAERVYQHLAEPARALDEARRCLAAGGRIVLIDQDWETLVFASDDVRAARDICMAFADSLVTGRIGRAYDGLLKDAGFGEVRVAGEAMATDDAQSYGFVTGLCAKAAIAAGLPGAAVADWEADQRRRMEAGRFFVSMTHFLASATRP